VQIDPCGPVDCTPSFAQVALTAVNCSAAHTLRGVLRRPIDGPQVRATALGARGGPCDPRSGDYRQRGEKKERNVGRDHGPEKSRTALATSRLKPWHGRQHPNAEPRTSAGTMAATAA
jgi:hypothetical protein